MFYVLLKNKIISEFWIGVHFDHRGGKLSNNGIYVSWELRLYIKNATT